MWGPLYLVLLAFAAYCTHVGIVVHVEFQHPDRMVALPTGAAAITWTLLAFTPEVTVGDGGATTAITLGPERWLFALLALLAALWLAGYVIGIFPERQRDVEDLSHAR